MDQVRIVGTSNHPPLPQQKWDGCGGVCAYISIVESLVCTCVQVLSISFELLNP